MKAPNKLYLPEDFMHAFMLDKPNPKRECIEYIRKDALIKWVKEWITEIHRVCDITDENGYRVDVRSLYRSFEEFLKWERITKS